MKIGKPTNESQSPNKMTIPAPNTPSPISVKLATLNDTHITTLSSLQRDEILLTNPNLSPFTADIPVLIVLLKDDKPLACGGLRLIDEEESTSVAEIKRVYVVPEARGQKNGISDFLLKQLELHAVEKGWKTLRLQTSRNMVAANRFYERHGYGVIENYGEYVGCEAAVSYEKTIV